MRKIFPNTPSGRVAAAAELPVDGKKELSINAEQIIVTTGDDVFVPPVSRVITTEAFRDRLLLQNFWQLLLLLTLRSNVLS